MIPGFLLTLAAIGSLGILWIALGKQGDPIVKKRSLRSNMLNYTEPPDQDIVCETIHICVVCMDNCTAPFRTMVKSLLYHRTTPLHFHLIVDSTSEKQLARVMESWYFVDVKFTCYNADYDLPKLAWIPNVHYAGLFTVSKLLIPDILPKNIEKVIVLDTDLTFLSDIAELWNIFRYMTDEQIIGLVEDQTRGWYNAEGHGPALGKGYNAGVILLYLNKIPNTYWKILIKEGVKVSAELQYSIREGGEMFNKLLMCGEQDIINAIIYKYPHLVHNVSCQFNLQLKQDSVAYFCYGNNVKAVKILHWNSQSRFSIYVPDIDYFRSRNTEYTKLNFSQLKETVNRCHSFDTTTVIAKASRIRHVSSQATESYRIKKSRLRKKKPSKNKKKVLEDDTTIQTMGEKNVSSHFSVTMVKNSLTM